MPGAAGSVARTDRSRSAVSTGRMGDESGSVGRRLGRSFQGHLAVSYQKAVTGGQSHGADQQEPLLGATRSDERSSKPLGRLDDGAWRRLQLGAERFL